MFWENFSEKSDRRQGHKQIAQSAETEQQSGFHFEGRPTAFLAGHVTFFIDVVLDGLALGQIDDVLADIRGMVGDPLQVPAD